MEQKKVYKYKDIEFYPVERNLEFHRKEYRFVKKLKTALLQEVAVTDEAGKINYVVDDEKFWDYIHTPENIKEILTTLTRGEHDKVTIDVDNDNDYTLLIQLVVDVITDFFSTYHPLTIR